MWKKQVSFVRKFCIIFLQENHSLTNSSCQIHTNNPQGPHAFSGDWQAPLKGSNTSPLGQVND